jgi:methyl-accepting chemotaxis protein
MLARFSDIPIGWKIFFAPAVLVSVLVGLGMYASHALRSNQASLVKLTEGSMRQAEAVAKFATAVWAAQGRLYYLTATAANETDQKKTHELATQASTAVLAVQETLQFIRNSGVAVDGATDILAQLDTTVAGYAKQAKNVVAMADRDAGSALMFMMGAARNFAEMIKLTDQLTQISNRIRDSEIENENASLDRQMSIFPAIALVAVLVGCITSLLVSASIARPVVNISVAIERIAGGDLDATVPGVGRRDEIGAISHAVSIFKQCLIERNRLESEAANVHRLSEEKLRATERAFTAAASEQTAVVEKLGEALDALARGHLTTRMTGNVAKDYEKLQGDFNHAATSLLTTITGVATTTDSIRRRSEEMARATDDLSRRTVQQATSVEETTAALGKITAMVRMTAQSTRQASAVVSAAKAEAETSGGVMREAVLAMGEIENSSQQIAKIIAVIDEIAFQTNLLALNAGIEAARAGDAGRGFAVVASEVRALAQRTVTAAKEIKGLISASTAHVKQGVGLVAKTGESLQRIKAEVTEINVLVTEIANGAQEQETRVQHVDAAIDQLDQVTQQNTAMVRETTAVSHTLVQEAGRLSQLIGRFRIDHSAAPEIMRTRSSGITPIRVAV